MKAAKQFYDERPPRGRRGAHVVKRISQDQTKPTNSLLGQRLRDLRLATGLNQAEAATKLGIGYGGGGRVSDHELGHHLPTLTLLQRYAELFGITVSELLRGIM